MPTISNWVTNIRKLKNALWNAEVKAQRGIEHQTQIKHHVHVCLARQGKKWKMTFYAARLELSLQVQSFSKPFDPRRVAARSGHYLNSIPLAFYNLGSM